MRLARTLAAAVLVALLAHGSASAAEYFNLAQLHVPAFSTTSGPAGTYPSKITVSGASGPIASVRVDLRWFVHQRPKDLDVLLVAPSGHEVMLMSDAGGTEPHNTEDPDDLVFSSTASTTFPVDSAPLNNTPYRAVNATEGAEPESDPMPEPAPAGPYGSDLSALHGTAADGEWRLYAVDDTTGNVGRLDDGWSLTLTYAASSADLSVSADHSPDGAEIGQAVTFTATVANAAASPGTATGADLEISLGDMIFKSLTAPPGATCYAPGETDPEDRDSSAVRCALAALPPGGSVQATVVAEMWRGDADVVHVEAHPGVPADPDPGNNVAVRQVPNPSLEPVNRPLVPTSTFPDPLPAPPANGTDREEAYTPPAPKPVTLTKPKRRRAGRGPGRLEVVAVPSPPLLFHGEKALLSATVRATGRRTRRAKVSFYLSADRRRGRGDVALTGRLVVPALKGGSEHTGAARAGASAKAAVGRHYLLACLRRRCAASRYATALGPKADPLDVAVTDAAGAQARMLGPGGGTLEATGADGSRFALDVPAGALDRSTTVTLVPVGGLSPFPLGRLAAAVRLEPASLGLLRPASLTILPAAAPAAAEATGFGFREGGRDLHLRPFARKARDLRFDISRFEGFGVAAATPAQQAQFWSVPPGRPGARRLAQARTSGRIPLGAEARAQQAARATLDRERGEALSGSGAGESAIGDVVTAGALSWYDNALSTMLERATTDPDWATPAVAELLSWQRQNELVGVENEEIAKRQADADKKLAKAIARAVDVYQERCDARPTPQDGARLLGAWRAWDFFHVGNVRRPDDKYKLLYLDRRNIRILVNCNRYEFKLDRRVDEDMHYDCSLWKGVGSGQGCGLHPTDWYAIVRSAFPLSPVPNDHGIFSIVGHGPLEYVHADFRQRNDQCSYKDPVFSGDLQVLVQSLAVGITHPLGNPTLGTRVDYSLRMRQGLSREQLWAHCDKLAPPPNTGYPSGLIDGWHYPTMMHAQSWYWIHAPQRVAENWTGGDPLHDLCTGPWQDPVQRYLFLQKPGTPAAGDVVARFDLRGAVTLKTGDKCLGEDGPVNFVADGAIEIAYRGVAG